MSEGTKLSETLNSWGEGFINFIISPNASNIVLGIIIAFVLIIWIYYGVKVFLDATKRFADNKFIQIVFLIMGLLSGPLGWVIYLITRPKYTTEDLEYIHLEQKFLYQNTATTLQCLKCGAFVLNGQTYCTYCGTQNRYKCEDCDSLTDYDHLFCFGCGKKFDKRFEKILKEIESKYGEEFVASNQYLVKNRSNGKYVFISFAEKFKKFIDKVNFNKLIVRKNPQGLEAVTSSIVTENVLRREIKEDKTEINTEKSEEMSIEAKAHVSKKK